MSKDRHGRTYEEVLPPGGDFASIEGERRVATGNIAQVPPFQQSMTPLIAVQICKGKRWVTAWEYKIPEAKNKGRLRRLYKELAADLVEDILDEMGVGEDV